MNKPNKEAIKAAGRVITWLKDNRGVPQKVIDVLRETLPNQFQSEREKGFREAARIYKPARDEDRQELLAAQAAIEKIDDYFRDPNGRFMVEGESTFDRVRNYTQELDGRIDDLESQLLQAQSEIAIFRKNWPQTHKAIRSDIVLAEAAEEIYALSELYKRLAQVKEK